jgi:hypothetical protein
MFEMKENHQSAAGMANGDICVFTWFLDKTNAPET